jgi:hypothetical protein
LAGVSQGQSPGQGGSGAMQGGIRMSLVLLMARLTVLFPLSSSGCAYHC